jgi:hypothetical protein
LQPSHQPDWMLKVVDLPPYHYAAIFERPNL